MENNEDNSKQNSENEKNTSTTSESTGQKSENDNPTEGKQKKSKSKEPVTDKETTETEEYLPSATYKKVKKADHEFIKSFATNGRTIPQAFAEVIRLAKREPEIKEIVKEIEKQVEVEKRVEIEKKLLPGQIIVSLDEETVNNIRKCRPFIAKKTDYMEYERGNDQAFINALVNRCVNKLLKYDFDYILK